MRNICLQDFLMYSEFSLGYKDFFQDLNSAEL